MSYEIKMRDKPVKYLKKLAKSAPKEFIKIDKFIYGTLSVDKNPCILPSAKYLQGYNDNRYRWRLGNYRIIGIVNNGEFKIIEIIKIDRRSERTYKGL